MPAEAPRGDAPAPHPDRIGAPVPLLPYLATALAAAVQGAVLAPLADDPRFPWRPRHAEAGRAAGRAMIRAHDPATLGPELLLDGLARVQRMFDGIERWQSHPYRREDPERPVLARLGAARLLDHGAGGGRPVLVVPSLVNPAHVLDILPDRSLLAHLAREGLRPVLLDWGDPDVESGSFDLGGHVERRILPALERLREVAGEAPALLGYCLGGTLSVAAAAARPELVSRLALLGAPWDFAGSGGLTSAALRMTAGLDRARLARVIEMAGAVFGAIPAVWVQEIFAHLDPLQAARKFRRFAEDPGDALSERLFVATEDWLNGGPPLAAPAARELLIDLQFDNATGRGAWSPLGRPVDPRALRPPVLVAAAQRDRITPPAAAEPLAGLIPGAELLRPAAGHVGMILGSRARDELWTPLTRFLRG